MGVVATTALEMGIDIGDLDATVLTGYPGSIASNLAAGRAERTGSEGSLSFLIGWTGRSTSILCGIRKPFSEKGYENALVNPENQYILRAHLICAAWELPLTKDDENYFGASFAKERDELTNQGI